MSLTIITIVFHNNSGTLNIPVPITLQCGLIPSPKVAQSSFYFLFF